MTQPPENAELAACPLCGAGPARPMTDTLAGFSGVEIMSDLNDPFVWCGTCGCQTRVFSSAAEAITAWNTRPSLSTPVLSGVREALEKIAATPFDDLASPGRYRLQGCVQIAVEALVLLPSETPNHG